MLLLLKLDSVCFNCRQEVLHGLRRDVLEPHDHPGELADLDLDLVHVAEFALVGKDDVEVLADEDLVLPVGALLLGAIAFSSLYRH